MVTSTALMAAASVALLLGILGILIDRKRVERLSLLPGALEFRMQKGRDYKILKTLPDFEFLEGENLYVANVCHGTLEGLKITAFDFHRETSIENQGRQQSRHIYNACFMTPCLAQDQILKNWSEEQDCPRHELLNADFTQSLDHGPDIYIEVRDDQLLMAIQGRIMPDQLIANLDLLQKIVARVNPVAV